MAKRRLEVLPHAGRCTRSGESNWRCSLSPPPRKLLLPQAPPREPRPPQVQEIHRHQTLGPGPPGDLGIPSNTSLPLPLRPRREPRHSHRHRRDHPSPSCGIFKTSSPASVSVGFSAFTHRVFFDSYGESYKTCPRKVEVWRLESERVVEVVSSFCDESGAVAAAMLLEDEEGVRVCRRQLHDGGELLRRFARKELSAFLHRVQIWLTVCQDGGVDSLFREC